MFIPVYVYFPVKKILFFVLEKLILIVAPNKYVAPNKKNRIVKPISLFDLLPLYYMCNNFHLRI